MIGRKVGVEVVALGLFLLLCTQLVRCGDGDGGDDDDQDDCGPVPYECVVPKPSCTVQIDSNGYLGNPTYGLGGVAIARQAWDSSFLNVEVARLLLTQILDVSVNIVDIDEYAMFSLLNNSQLDVCLELWTENNKASIYEYISSGFLQSSPLGVIGQIGWYFQSFVLTDWPNARDWSALSTIEIAQVSSVFNDTLLEGPPDWKSYDGDIITNNRYPLSISRVKDEADMLSRIALPTPALFYWWTPHYIFTDMALNIKVTVECYSRAAVGGIYCDYPGDVLLKVLSPFLQRKSPSAYYLLQKFSYTNNDQIQMLAKACSIEEAACYWVKQNVDVWTQWLPNCSATPLPVVWIAVPSALCFCAILLLGIVLSVIFVKRKNKIQQDETLGFKTEVTLDFGGFVIEHKDLKIVFPPIAMGASGVVSKAYYRHSIVAVKTFVEANISDGSVESFRKEVSLLQSLRHPNIVLFIGATVTPPLSIVTELAANGSLFDVIQTQTKKLWDWSIRLQIALDSALGMEYLHSLTPPLMHRDLKSANILIDDTLTAKIAGISTHIRTIMSKTLGTVRWSAPEVLRNSGEYTAKADVYSFGIVLWEISKLQIPYAEFKYEHEIETYVREGGRPLWDFESSDFAPPPVLFLKLIRTCWAENPDDRPNFEEVASLLHHMKNQDHANAAATPPPASITACSTPQILQRQINTRPVVQLRRSDTTEKSGT
ncbi:protein tyrosine kinase [Pelomyxa schiedti]|nr:protein tyrosine kinase [Pelomyxa schiedti]